MRGQGLLPGPPPHLVEAAEFLDVLGALQVRDMPGQPPAREVLAPWAAEFAYYFGGTLDPATGRRTVREFFLLVPKKNWKSGLIGLIGLTTLIRNWRHSAELLILAPTKEAADNSFRVARDAVVLSGPLSRLIRVRDHMRTLIHRETAAELRVLAADSATVVGRKASLVICDELHLIGGQSGGESMLQEATGGLSSRPEGAVIYISTMPDKSPAGVFRHKLYYARKVRDGSTVDPAYLPVIYEPTQEMVDTGGYLEPEAWPLLNPGWGRSVDPGLYAAQLAQAREAGGDTWVAWQAKYLNLEPGRVAAVGSDWALARHWHGAEDPTLSLDTLISRSSCVVAAADGGGLDDLYALTVAGLDREAGHWLAVTHMWACESLLRRHSGIASRLRDADRDGHLTIYPETDPDCPSRESAAWVRRVEPLLPRASPAVGEDMAPRFVELLIEGGLRADRIVRVPQGYSLSDALADAELACAGGRLRHAPCPLLAWMVGNVRLKYDSGGRRMMTRETEITKIDGCSSLVSAIELVRRVQHMGGAAPQYRTLYL